MLIHIHIYTYNTYISINWRIIHSIKKDEKKNHIKSNGLKMIENTYTRRNTCGYIREGIHVGIHEKEYMWVYTRRNTCGYIREGIHVGEEKAIGTIALYLFYSLSSSEALSKGVQRSTFGISRNRTAAVSVDSFQIQVVKGSKEDGRILSAHGFFLGLCDNNMHRFSTCKKKPREGRNFNCFWKQSLWGPAPYDLLQG